MFFAIINMLKGECRVIGFYKKLSDELLFEFYNLVSSNLKKGIDKKDMSKELKLIKREIKERDLSVKTQVPRERKRALDYPYCLYC